MVPRCRWKPYRKPYRSLRIPSKALYCLEAALEVTLNAIESLSFSGQVRWAALIFGCCGLALGQISPGFRVYGF